ncbi:unnamed protein product [Aureobasidium uvarum]|uniref:Pentatricopeptide repeat protein n=1 Tax=Aureobasidium uvarum TaxID=2773716 RepID=A0A9N8KNE1_9PEZI|nr:unnamed protein product [Aureobasidium uvarum]
MFQSRRRVPSEGALRVLRQLAYISSGTACGAAAIVAEERRRQTNLVSKIAENSRRLKQHPRHQHGHAAQRRRADDAARSTATSTSARDQLPDNQLLSLPDDKPLPQAETFRNHVLPSEVERGYAKLNSHQPPNKGKSQPAHNPQSKHQPTKIRPKYRRQDYDLSFFTTALKTHGPTSAVARFNIRCNDLIDRRQVSEAFGLLRAAIHHLKTDGISIAPLHPLADRLFDSYLANENYQSCSRLLHHMNHQGSPITHYLHRLAIACIEPIQPTLLIKLNEKFGDRIPLPRRTYPALCAAYSTRNSELCALLFAKHIRQEDRLSVLPLCEPAWPVIIDHMWSVTKNYHLVDSLFIHMCKLSDHPPLALYNAMIHVCIKFGRLDRAHHHLHTIQQSQHLRPDIVTFGHFVFQASSDADWPPAEDLMAMLVRAGETEAPPEKRTDLFVPVLKAYAKRHHPEEVWAFAFKAIDEYGVLPDPRILSTGLGNLIRIGRLEMLSPWVDKMRTYDLGAEITPGIALAMMRQFYFDTRPSYTIMVWLCCRLMNNVPGYWSPGVLNLLREAVAYDLRSYRAGQAHRVPHAMHMLRMLQEVRLDSPSLPKPLYWNQLQQLADKDQARVPSSDSNFQDAVKKEVQTKDQPQDLQDTVLSDDESSMHDLLDAALSTAKFKKSSNEHEMLMALSEGRYTDVLKLYENSLGQSGLPASSYSLEMAMQARTQLPDDAGALGDHIDMASEAGMDTIAALLPLLNHKVQNSAIGSRMHVDELCNTVWSFYENMVKNSVTIRHHLATSAATVLLQNGKPNDAIRLLSQIYLSPWAEKVPLDLPAMTVLLQAYIHVRHSLGAEWVIKEVLEKDYRVDYAFMTVIRKAKISAKSRASVGGEKGMNNLRLSKMLDYYSKVGRAKQMAQIKAASRLGNRLVNAMIKLARPPSTDAIWQQQAQRHGIDPMMWSGRGSMWRVSYTGRFRRRGRRRPNFAKY